MKYSIFLFLTLFTLSGCFHEYFEHWENTHTQPKLSEVQSPPLQGNLSTLPDKAVLEKLIALLDAATERIWVETYTWTEKETQEAIIRAKNRGVDVRVLLERNVYQTPRINDAVIEKLGKVGISTKYTSENFTFTHMKLWFIDHMWCVSTGNWSYTSFTKNREFIFCSEDILAMKSLEEIFLSDYQYRTPNFQSGGLDSRIGLAPLNLRDFLKNHIGSAQQEIIVYNQSITDNEIMKNLSLQMARGIHVELCQAESSKNPGGNIDIPFFFSSGPYLHAKIFLIDGRGIFLGSANMTQNALDNNREIMVKIENNPIMYQKIKNLYNNDCKKQH